MKQVEYHVNSINQDGLSSPLLAIETWTLQKEVQVAFVSREWSHVYKKGEREALLRNEYKEHGKSVSRTSCQGSCAVAELSNLFEQEIDRTCRRNYPSRDNLLFIWAANSLT